MASQQSSNLVSLPTISSSQSALCRHVSPASRPAASQRACQPASLNAHSLHTPCRLFAHSTHTPCRFHAESMQTPCRLHTHSMQTPCSLPDAMQTLFNIQPKTNRTAEKKHRAQPTRTGDDTNAFGNIDIIPWDLTCPPTCNPHAYQPSSSWD